MVIESLDLDPADHKYDGREGWQKTLLGQHGKNTVRILVT